MEPMPCTHPPGRKLSRAVLGARSSVTDDCTTHGLLLTCVRTAVKGLAVWPAANSAFDACQKLWGALVSMWEIIVCLFCICKLPLKHKCMSRSGGHFGWQATWRRQCRLQGGTWLLQSHPTPAAHHPR